MDSQGQGRKRDPVSVIHRGRSVLCALYSIGSEVGVARTSEERVFCDAGRGLQRSDLF